MRPALRFAFLALLLLAGAGQAQAQVDLSGDWELSWEGPRGATTTTFTFQQDGESFTGTAQVQGRGARPGGGGEGGAREVAITDGVIDGQAITFSMAMGVGQRSMTFTFSGTVEGDSMEGTITNPRGEMPFTGLKK
jgi:hypothetical protein